MTLSWAFSSEAETIDGQLATLVNVTVHRQFTSQLDITTTNVVTSFLMFL